MSAKRVRPGVLPPLKEALTLVFWYKQDLRAFLASCTSNRQLIAQLDWTNYKRAVVGQLVDTLASQQHRYFDDLLNLLFATADITDPAHLRRIEDGEKKYADAVAALKTLRQQVEPYRKLREEEEQAARRREEQQARADMQRAITDKLEELKAVFYRMVSEPPQQRGYSLEKLLNELFALFDIDAKAPFRIMGEQIDGAFTFDGTEFLLEAKWQAERTAVADLDVFAGKIGRKLDNTLGLFVSMNGYQDSAVDTHSRNRPVMILMDGADLSAVIENRISLPELLTLKRQHAARTGEVFIGAYQVV